jgi:hypothetical protein
MNLMNRRERRALLGGHYAQAEWYLIDHMRRLANYNGKQLDAYIARGGRNPLCVAYRL